MAEELNNTPVTEGEESLGNVFEIRRNKLFELQKADMDPYMEVKYDVIQNNIA